MPGLFVPAPFSVSADWPHSVSERSHGENSNVTYVLLIRFHTVTITLLFCQREQAALAEAAFKVSQTFESSLNVKKTFGFHHKTWIKVGK